MKLVIVPLVSLVVMVPLTLIVIGPIGVYVGEGIANVVNWLIERSGILTGVLNWWWMECPCKFWCTLGSQSNHD